MNPVADDKTVRSALPARPWEEVPSEVAERLRPGLDALVEEVIDAIRLTVPAYRRSLSGEFGAGLRNGVADALGKFLDLIRDGGEMPAATKQLYAEFGRWEAGEGRRLESLLAAYRLGARISWRRIAETIRGEELGEQTVALLAESVFAYIDELSAVTADGFAAELADRAGELDRRRRALVRLLVEGPAADPTVVRDAAAAISWEPPAELAALVYRGSSPDRVAAHLPAGSLTATIEDASIALIPDPGAPGRRAEIERALRGRPGALGTPVPWEQAHRSADRALAIHRIRESGMLSSDGLLAADDHLAALVTLSNPALLDDLAARRLAPLEGLTDGAAERLELTLLAWLDHQGVVKDAADSLHVHPQTVRYRVAQLRELFGDELDEPEARYELLLALRSKKASRR